MTNQSPTDPEQPDELCDAAESIVAGAVLSAPDIDTARRLLEIAPAEAYRHPVAAFVVDIAAKLVAELVEPGPAAVVTWATQQGIPLPVRDTPIAALARMAATSPAYGNPRWAAREVNRNHQRRRITAAGRRLEAAAWSNPDELTAVVAEELAVIRAATDALAVA